MLRTPLPDDHPLARLPPWYRGMVVGWFATQLAGAAVLAHFNGLWRGIRHVLLVLVPFATSAGIAHWAWWKERRRAAREAARMLRGSDDHTA